MVRTDSPAEKAAADRRAAGKDGEMTYDRSLATAPGDPLPDTGARVGTPRAPARTEGPVPGGAALEPEDVAPRRGRATIGLLVLGAIIAITILLAVIFAWQGPDPIEGPVIEGSTVEEGTFVPAGD